jgi:hypothetical protein
LRTRVRGRCYCNGRGPECSETQQGYDASSISVEISLPRSMRPFRRKLEAKIDEYLIRFLD